MKEFVEQNLNLIISTVLGIVSIILLVVKKTKIKLIDTPFSKLILKLPEIIAKAETVSPVGQEKKSFALGVSYAFLADLTGKTIEQVCLDYKDRISAAIESILETPQKKEVK